MRNLQRFAPLALAVVLAGCRQDMHDQPRFKSLAKSDFYADQRSARNPVDGTVARGQLHEDVYFYTGKVGANPGNYLPFAATADLVQRGRERYNIYCAPCHSQVGDGQGMIVKRGFQAPPTLHQTRLRNAPLGYLFDVITNGFGAMPDYASQIPPRDRWAIVAYIKALQLSQAAAAGDVPSGQKMPSPELEFHGDPPSGAVQPELYPKGAPQTSEEPK